jgi:hypothetical protein
MVVYDKLKPLLARHRSHFQGGGVLLAELGELRPTKPSNQVTATNRPQPLAPS